MKIKKIYLVHHTHFDIGFTDMPEEVQRQQLHYLDQAIRYCGENPKYRWTIESGLLVRNYLACRPESEREKLLKYLRNGQLEVGAFDMQMLTETASFGELLANASRPAALGKKYGFPVECAILDDIGGIAGEVPTALNAAGIKYLLAGVGACQAELPWADLPHAFYMKSRSGGKILIWNLGIDRTEPSTESKYPFAVYGLGAIYLGYRGFEELLDEKDLGITFRLSEEANGKIYTLPELFNILTKRLERENYPFEEILLQYGGDNRMPAEHLPQLVEKLNATGQFPEIELTTPRHFFKILEDKYGASLPEITGVLADPWNLRMNSVPSVMKNHRYAQRKYLSSQLNGMNDPELFEAMMLVADHTFGLNNWGWQKIVAEQPFGIRAPYFDRYRDSWAEKAHYSRDAKHRAEVLERKMNSLKACQAQDSVVLRNGAPHEASGYAELYFSSYAPLLSSLKDANGNEVPRQQIGLNRWIIDAKNVPALGAKCLKTEFSKKWGDIYTPPALKPVPHILKTDFYECVFDGFGGISELRTKGGTNVLDCTEASCAEPEIEVLLDCGKENEHCSLMGCFQREKVMFGDKKADVTEDGELFMTVVQRSTCRYCTAVTEMRFWKHEARVDFSVRFDMPETPDKLCCRVKFPFAGNGASFTYDQNAGTATPDMLMPGSIEELLFCSRFAVLNAGNYSAVLCCPDSPALEFGGNKFALWRKELPFRAMNNHVGGIVFNNLCNTDVPAWYPIMDNFRYSLFISDNAKDVVDAQAMWEECTALSAEYCNQAPSEECKGLPKEIRMHADEDGNPWIENLGDKTCKYDFTLRGKSFSGALAPYQIVPLSF